MVQIPVDYRVSATPVRSLSPFADPGSAGVVGAGLQQIAQAGRQVALEWQDQRDASDATAFRSETLMWLVDKQDELQRTAPEGGRGYTQSLIQSLSEYQEQNLSQLSPGAQRRLQEWWGLLQADTYDRALRWERETDQANQLNQLNRALNNYQTLAFRGTPAEALLGVLEDDLAGMAGTYRPEVIEEFRQKGQQAIAMAEQLRLARTDPMGTIGRIAPFVDQGTSSIGSTIPVPAGFGGAPVPHFSPEMVSSDFGPRAQPPGGGSTDHKGVDIAVPVGTPVGAIAAGTVVRAEYSESYGNVIYVDTPEGFQVRYAHLERLGVKAGDRVERGQLLGASGRSGVDVSGPHLHIEVRQGGGVDNSSRPIDPMPFLTAGGQLRPEYLPGREGPQSIISEAPEPAALALPASPTMQILDAGTANFLSFQDQLSVLGEAEQSQRGMLAEQARIDQLAEEEEKRRSAERANEALLAIQDGTFTRDQYLELQPQLLPDDARVVLRAMDEGGAGAATDPGVYVDLMTRARTGEDVAHDASIAVQNGTLSLSDYRTLLTEVDQRTGGGDEPDWIKSERERLEATLRPSPFETDMGLIEPAQRRLTQALREFNAWATAHPQAAPEEVYRFNDQLMNRWSFGMSAPQLELPIPRFATGVSADQTGRTRSFDVAATAAATIQHYTQVHGGDAAAALADPEYQREAELIVRWSQLAAQQAP